MTQNTFPKTTMDPREVETDLEWDFEEVRSRPKALLGLAYLMAAQSFGHPATVSMRGTEARRRKAPAILPTFCKPIRDKHGLRKCTRKGKKQPKGSLTPGWDPLCLPLAKPLDGRGPTGGAGVRGGRELLFYTVAAGKKVKR